MRKVSGILADTTELKKLIAEHPDYPICVLASEDANIGEWGWMYCSDIRFSVGEILDCTQDINDEKVYSDRDDFEEDLADCLSNEYEDLDETSFEEKVKEELAKYEPYWKDCIFIYADNQSDKISISTDKNGE